MFLIYAFAELNGISNTFYIKLKVDVAMHLLLINSVKFHKGFQLDATLKTFSNKHTKSKRDFISIKNDCN